MIDTSSNWDKDETYRSEGHLSIANVPHLFDEEEEFARVKGLTEIQLSEVDSNWSWKDVISIIPMSDAWDNKPILRPRSSIHRHEYMISSSADEVYQALCHAIDHFEMMRSIAVVKSPREESHTLSNGVPFANTWFAILKQSTLSLIEKLITTIEVDSIERDMNTAFQDDYHDGTRVQSPGWLVHFTIVKSSKEPKRCGLLYQIHHAIFDMTSISLFLDVVEDHLNGNTARKSTPSYGPYAFWRYTLPFSSQGQDSVDFNAKLLSGIAQTAGKAAMWPPKRAKGWMRGNDNGCDRSERTPLGPTGSKQKGLYNDNFAINVKGIQQLRVEHGLSPAKVVKGAQILFNVWKTGATEAVFVGAEGGRMVKGVFPSSIDMLRVPGQVAEGSITRFSVPSRDEKVLDFLRRVQEDQLLLSKYNPCHRGHVVAALSRKIETI
jgi:hypothetical protein